MEVEGGAYGIVHGSHHLLPGDCIHVLRLLDSQLYLCGGGLDESHYVPMVHAGHIFAIHCQKLVVHIELLTAVSRTVRYQTTWRGGE